MSIPTFVREQLNMADEKPQELSDVNLREHIRAMEETYIESMNIKNAHLTAAQTKMQILQERLQQKEAEMHQSLEAKDKVIAELHETIESLDLKCTEIQSQCKAAKTQVEILQSGITYDQIAAAEAMAELQVLRERVEALEQEKRSPKVCYHCKKEYFPLQNDRESCSYHPWRVRYGGCKDCGKDAYYACCGRCAECSVGCRISRHVS